MFNKSDKQINNQKTLKIILILTAVEHLPGLQLSQELDFNECSGIKKYHLKSDYTKWKYSQALSSSENIIQCELRFTGHNFAKFWITAPEWVQGHVRWVSGHFCFLKSTGDMVFII